MKVFIPLLVILLVISSVVFMFFVLKPKTATTDVPRTITTLSSVGAGSDLGSGTKDTFMCDGSSSDYINQINIKSANDVDSIQFQCQSSKTSSVYGGTGGTAQKALTGPFSTLSGRGGSWIDNIAGYGGTTGAPWTITCPDNQSIVGFDVISGKYLGQLTPKCAQISASKS